MLEIKWRRPKDVQSGLVTHIPVPSFDQDSSTKDFIVYSCVPAELLVVLVLCCFPRATMETACSVEKTGMKLTLECGATLKARTSQFIAVTQ